MKFRQAITPLLWRVMAFVCLFVVISGLIGPRVISGGILFRDGFAIYGGIGKAFIFSLITFVLLIRHGTAQGDALLPWKPRLLGWFLASLLAFMTAWIGITGLLINQQTTLNLILAHAGILFSVGFTVIGCFGLGNLRIIWHDCKRAIMESVVVGVAFYVFLLVVYALWQLLASTVLVSVTGLLAISGLHATIVLPDTLMFTTFSITIAEYCSGIESIALFTGLYVVVGLLDWKRLNKRRYLSVFPLALLVLFGLNIIRVYGLIMAGYYINPDIAFSLFHTYAGLLFFILYSAVFWLITYNYLLNKESSIPHKRLS